VCTPAYSADDSKTIYVYMYVYALEHIYTGLGLPPYM
jgi:hypothetical protein